MHNKAFNIAKNQKYDRFQRGLASIVYNFLIKKSAVISIKKENISNKELTEELQKPIKIDLQLNSKDVLKVVILWMIHLIMYLFEIKEKI